MNKLLNKKENLYAANIAAKEKELNSRMDDLLIEYAGIGKRNDPIGVQYYEAWKPTFPKVDDETLIACYKRRGGTWYSRSFGEMEWPEWFLKAYLYNPNSMHWRIHTNMPRRPEQKQEESNAPPQQPAEQKE